MKRKQWLYFLWGASFVFWFLFTQINENQVSQLIYGESLNIDSWTLVEQTDTGLSQSAWLQNNLLSFGTESLDEMMAAWHNARDIGAYEYKTKIVQTTWPILDLENIGLGPKKDHIYVEGETDLTEEFMHIKLWADDGSIVGDPQHEIKIEDGQSWAKAGAHDWVPQEQDISDLFAPGNDPLAYLVAADDAANNGDEIRVLPFLEDGLLVYTRYTFALDGPTFASYMRDNLEEALRRKGELPPGISLNTAEFYRKMTGTGELLVDDAGLPKRLTIKIEFPPQGLERVEATLTTDFMFPFGVVKDGEDDDLHLAGEKSLMRLISSFRRSLVSWQGENIRGSFVAISLTLSFATLLLMFGDSKKLYVALAITIILSMLITPLLSSQQTLAYSQKQAEAKAQYDEEQAKRQAQTKAEVALEEEQFDPYMNPMGESEKWESGELVESRTAVAVDDTDTDGDGLWDVDEITLALDPKDADTDGDGLDDGVEMLELGTSPYSNDTDEDGFSDFTEVNGFYFDGTKYYTNPNDADTNGDGRVDLLEATIITETIHAYDSDGDGTPDLFDYDDDNDKVPDGVDIAPTEVITGLSESDTSWLATTEFEFQLNGLTANKPTFVDFQIRPENQAHIGYAFNVLDWPAFEKGPQDIDGQITRLRETTFGTSGKDANGDMKLIPYLEITIPYDEDNKRYGLLPLKPGIGEATKTIAVTEWLDTDETEALGIAVRCETIACNRVIAEVPLTVVHDRDNDGQATNPVAFAGRMFYRTDLAGYRGDQKVRLVWHIIGLVDVCSKDDYDDCWEKPRRPKYENWVETRTLMHSYYDDFYITGLNVVEDHGLQAGVLFEDPTSVISQPDYDPDTHYGVNTWDLSLGLGRFFISRFQDACGRNVTDLDDVAAALLDKSQTIQDCWELDGNFGMLQYEYEHQGRLGKLALEDANDVLETHFLDESGKTHIANPTLIYLMSETNRVATLESAIDIVPPLSGGVYQISMSGDPSVTVTMNWATYEHNENSGWSAVDVQTYLAEMEETLRAVLSEENAFTGYVDETIVFAVSYYIRMYIGVSDFSIVQGTRIEEPKKLKLKFKATKIGKKVAGALKYFESLRTSGDDLVKIIDPALKNSVTLGKNNFTLGWQREKFVFGVVSIFVTFFQGVVEIYKLTIPFIKYSVCKGYEHLCPDGFLRALEISDYVAKAISLALKAVSLVIKTITKMVDTVFKIAKDGIGVLAKISSSAGKTIAFGLLGLGLSTLISASLLFTTIFISGKQGEWQMWVKGIASIAASVVLGVVLLIMGLIPFISIVIIIIGLIDLLISTACFVVNTIASELDEDNANHETLDEVNTALQNTICPGVMGWAAKLITPYSDQAMIDLSKEDRLQTGNFDIKIVNPNNQIQEGDLVVVSANVTTTIYNVVPSGSAAFAANLLYFTHPELLGLATFEYVFDTEKMIPTAEYGYYDGKWNEASTINASALVSRERLWQEKQIQHYGTFEGAGINERVVQKFYLNEGWAVPLLHCVTVICIPEAKYDEAHYPFDFPLYDIFPTTLDGFYALDERGAKSYALAWDYLFPILKDADGDGLRNRYQWGNDPDDKYFDVDNDGLSDFYEKKVGSHPSFADFDSDQLNDYLEILHETHPRRPDTDNDGLTDWEEVQGWEFVYAFAANGDPLVTLVQSDPLRRDTDGDSISDKQEKLYGLNPQVYSNDNIIGLFSRIDDADGYVLPGTTIHYTSTVENNLKGRYAYGRYEVDPADPLQGGDVNEGYVLPPLDERTYTGSTTVPASLAQSGSLTVTHWAGAQITDLREEQNGRIMVLHLDEAMEVGKQNGIYLDASLNGHNGQCWSRCPSTDNGGILGRGADFSSGDRINVAIDIPQDEYALSFLFRTDKKDMGIFSADPTGDSDLTLYLDADGDVCAMTADNTVCSQNTNHADNDWHHIVHTYLSNVSGTQQWLFIDGTLADQGTTGTLMGTAPTFVDIGYSRHDVASDSSYEGIIDEVEIFDKVLSVAEVQDLTTAFAGGENGPITELPFEDDFPYLISADTSLHGLYAHCLFGPDNCPSTAVGVGGFGADTARDFDGNDDFMTLQMLGQVQKEFSIAFWFKSLQVAGEADDWWDGALMFSSFEPSGVGYGVSLGNGYLMFGVGDKTISHTVKLADNQWHHVAATRNQDGHLNLIVQDPNPAQIVGPTTNFSGALFGKLGQNKGLIAYDGLIDNFKLYDRVLSRSEIDALALGVRRIEIGFDESSERTVFLDSTGNGYNGTCDFASGSCPGTGFAGPFQGASYFNGVNDVIALQNSAPDSTFIGDYTLSLWVKPQPPGGTILSKGAISKTIRLSIDATGKVHLDRDADNPAYSASLISSDSVNWDAWNHIAVVYDRQNMTLFVNGASAGGGTMPSRHSHWDNSAPVLIGAEDTTGGSHTNFFKGHLDEVWIYERPLQPEKIMRLREKGPAIWMPLDEGPGVDSFANIVDSANQGTCTLDYPPNHDCRCPDSGGIGHFKQAAWFANTSSYGTPQCVAVPHDNANGTEVNFTFGAWIKPTEKRNRDQVLLLKTDYITDSLLVTIPKDSFKVSVQVPYWPHSMDSWTSQEEMTPDEWNHIMVTLAEDGKRFAIYLNGKLDSISTRDILDVSLDLIKTDRPVYLAPKYESQFFNYYGYSGPIDDAVVYNIGLNSDEIKALYDYQSVRYDTKIEQPIIVDADDPTVWLDLPIDYIRPITVVLSAGAADQTMEVTQVEYRLDGGDWLPATQDGDAWLFYYLPADQGQQTIDLRATDTLGNVGTENRTLTLDDTPPNVTLGTADLICDATFCMLTLDGTVTDAGSGVEAVYIDIIEPGGRSLILSGNAAYLQGDQWSLILEPMLYPSNDTFTVILTAVDKVGNYIETIDDSSRSNSGGQPDHTLHLDITPPIADLTDMGVPGGYTDTLAGTAANLPVISGTITDIPYPLSTLIQMHFEEPVGAMGFHDGTSRRTIGTCSGVSCPIAGGSGKYGRGLTFESGDVVDLGMQPVIDGAADNFTAMAWIYLNDTIGVKTIIDADTTNSLDGFGFSVVDAGLRVDAYGVHVYDSTKITLPTNEWVHVAAAMDHVADGSAYAVLFYVNGLPVDYATHAVPPILNKDDPIQIGAGFVGMLDEVYLFNIVPTPAMIKDIARPVSLGVNKLEVGLLHVKDWGNLDKVSWGTASLNAPGEIFSTWSYTLPTNLEGEYQIYLRTTDELPRSQILPSVWQGQIDTHPPRAELRYTPPRFPGDWHLLQCWVEDFNLTEQGYDCPVPGSLPESYEESWYTSVIPTQKLHRFVSPATSLHSFSPLETMTAYDSHGAKTIVSATISNQNWLLGTAILTPTARSTANPLQAVLIEGAAYAQASLKTITVTANTVPVYTENWTAGAVNQKAWTAVFTPTQEGGYTLLAEAQDWAGGVITSSAPVAGMVAPQTIVYVDAADPLITITTTHVTAANFDINGFVGVSGLLTETNEVRSLEVKLETPTQTGMWETIPLSDTTALVGAPWQARVYAGSPTPPKGETYTITARVTDVVGKVGETSRTVFADAAPPEFFQVALSYTDDTGAQRPVARWETIADPLAPTLIITWTESSDASGLSGYHVEWLTHVHDVEQIVAQEDVTNHRTAFFIAAEAQKYSVRVTARDIYGNETARTFGPFFVDYKTTPVYIGLDANAELPDPLYPDWTAAACNQAGTDTRVSEKALPGATLGTEQKLHTSWDADGLHLAWTGANWDYDGDLFIYLDTKPGGSVQAYNPFVTKVISDTYLPAYQDGSTTYRMGADYLVWIKTITDTALLAWDGSQWVGRASPWDFAFDFLERVPYTDIYLPFSSLDNPTTLSLVAFATEEKAFRLWAALPVENPLSSAQVVNTLPDENRPFLLTHCYAWDNLGSGVCPANRVVEGFPPLGVSLTASTAEPFPGETGEPAGLVYSLLGQNLPTTSADELTALSGWDVLLTPACLAQPESSACERKIETGTRVGYDQQYALAHLLGVNPPVLGQGRAVSYTLNLINNDSTTITDVVAHIDTWGPIRLTGGTQHSDAVGEYDTLEMPPVTLSAGEVITYTFAGYVDGAFDPANNNGWGTLNIVVLDRNGINTLDANGRDNYNFPIEWLYVDHKIDLQGPVYLEIENSTGVLTPGQNEISGLVIAQSSVPTITLVVTDSLNSMPKQTFVCPDDQPSNQEWMCPIDVTGIPETASVYISGQAINVYGMPSLWFQSGPFKIDTSLPEINFGSSTQIALSDGYINANELSWQGVASDTFSLDHAEICDPTIATDNCETVSLQITRVAEIANPTLTMDDKTEQPIGACNAPTTIPFDVAENKPVLDVDLGLNLTHPARDELQIVLVAPSGDAVTLYAGGTHQKNFDLNLDDAQAISVEQDMYAHRTGAPFFAFNRRPLELLYAFRNQMAQGQWQLHICDINPGENHGTYHRSRLLLTYRQYPKGTEGFWNYTVFGDTTDGEVITRTFTAVDGVGNRGNPRTAMFTLDVVAPSISVETITAVSNTITLKGTATDGTDIKTLWLDIFSPLGNLETHKLVLAGGEWAFVGAPTVDGAPDGVYRLFVRAEDNAGNLTRSEPYDLVLPGTLHVVEVTPLNLADNVSVKDPIRISFNGAMDTGSVTIIITPTLPLTPMWGADNMLLSLEHPMLAMKTPYTVTIQSGSGQNGDPLSNLPYRWHFTTTQNTLPTAVDDITQTNEDTPITIYVLDNDTDNETPGQLTVVAVGQPVSGTVINLGTNVQFDPDGAFEHLPPGLTTTESFTYTMTDGTDGFATALVTITISGINDRPQVDAGPDQVGFEGSAFLFDGHFSDPGKRPPPVGVHWDFGDGHAVTESISHTHTYQDNGIFTATLTITDAHGGVGMDTAVVTVDNVAPTVSVGPDQQGTVGEQLKFTGVLTDPGGMDTHSITWDFGDGQSITGTLTPTYRYNATGSFTITLTVVDDDGGKGVDQMVVNLDEDRKYLPLLLHNYSTLPDLIGELRLIPDKKHFVADEPVTLVVTVTNIGNSAADAFWVDLYINPDKPPIAANLSWDKTCTLSPCYGIAWGVLGLGAGESIVLTSVKDSYAEEYTYWENTFALGTTELYLYVDSWDLSHTYGAIQESNESNNRADLLGLHVISSRTYFPRVFPLVHEIR